MITGASVLQREILVIEFFPIDRASTSAVMICKIASLTHLVLRLTLANKDDRKVAFKCKGIQTAE